MTTKIQNQALSQSSDRLKSINVWLIVGWLYLAIAFVFLLLPIVTLVLFSFEDSRFPKLPWSGWTLRWYQELIAEGSLIKALQHSLIVSPLAAAAACLIGFFAAYALNRFNFFGKRFLSIVLIVPILVPSLILGVAFLGLLSRLNLQGQLLSIFLTHVVILIPATISMITLRLFQMPADLEAAAWNLGATEWQALFRVVLPWTFPGMIGAWLLAFTFSFDEFVIAWFVSGFEQTLPVAIYNFLGANLSPTLNAVGTIIFLISIVLLVGVELFLIPLLIKKP